MRKRFKTVLLQLRLHGYRNCCEFLLGNKNNVRNKILKTQKKKQKKQKKTQKVNKNQRPGFVKLKLYNRM